MKPKEIEKFYRPLRLLLIEDNPIDRKMIESMVSENNDFTSFFRSCACLDDALKELEEHDFEIIVLDLNLPDSSGDDTIRRLNQQYPEIAIVVNTGAYEDAEGIATLSIGAQDFLVKGEYTSYSLNKTLHYAIERKRLEKELREALDNIQGIQQQLIETEKMKIVGRLASGVAHEVKNPLATILYGTTYLKENTELTDITKNVLDNIETACNRANEIIADLLDFSSISQLKKEKIAFNDVINKAINLTIHQINKKKVDLELNLQENLPDIHIDKNRIEQVIINLIVNSIHASEAGGKINISSSLISVADTQSPHHEVLQNNFADYQNVILFSVEDHGSGIPLDKIKSIFEPFFTTKRTEGGVGLGLSISKTIIENHQGQLLLQNKDDSPGVKASFILPIS